MNLLPLFFACSVCMPDPTSDVAKASSTAILFMIGVLFCMFALLIKIMLNFARKQREFENPSL